MADAEVQLFVTQEDLEDQLSAAEMRALLDDNNDGEADYAPVTRLLKNASSKVSSYLRNIYILPITVDIPNEVKRLTLEVAEYMVCRRFPSATEKDWVKLKKAVEDDLMKLREGKVRLDVPSLPEPAANSRGARLFAQTNDGCPTKKFFVGGMGDF